MIFVSLSLVEYFWSFIFTQLQIDSFYTYPIFYQINDLFYSFLCRVHLFSTTGLMYVTLETQLKEQVQNKKEISLPLPFHSQVMSL